MNAADHPPRRTPLGWLYLVLIVACAVVVASPLLQPGYFWGAHDARHDVYFIFEYDKAVQDGIWLPGWGPDWAFGYGYPFWIIYAPLATFLGELFHHFLKMGYESSVKAVLALSILGSGLAMYGFVRSWLGRNAGLVAAVAYIAIPYHLVDLFVRAAMAESVALVFLPLALWGFRETIVRPRLAAILGAGVAYAAIMWTSNLVALVFTPPLALYALVQVLWVARDRHFTSNPGGDEHEGEFHRSPLAAFLSGAWPPAVAILVGLGLSAAFFVPAFVEQRYINQAQWFGEYYNPAAHFVYFNQLFDPSWGFGISEPGPDDASLGAMSYQLGAATALLSAIALAVARRSHPKIRRELWLWGLWAIGSVLLTLDVSALAWKYIPIVPYAQFPWRYLMLAIVPLSLLPGALLAEDAASGPGDVAPRNGNPGQASSTAPWAALCLSALLVLSSLPYLRVEIREPTIEQGPVSMAALMRFQNTSDEMTGVTAWVDPAQRPRWSDMAELWVQGREVRTRVDYSQVPQNETLAVNSEEMGSAHEQIYFYARDPGQSITFNRFWYPGWTAWLLDGKDGRPVQQLPLAREQGPLARVVVSVPAGEGYMLLRFEDTPLRAAAKWVTLAAVAAIVAALVAAAALRARRPGFVVWRQS